MPSPNLQEAGHAAFFFSISVCLALMAAFGSCLTSRIDSLLPVIAILYAVLFLSVLSIGAAVLGTINIIALVRKLRSKS